jgi:hypothetical protein
MTPDELKLGKAVSLIAELLDLSDGAYGENSNVADSIRAEADQFRKDNWEYRKRLYDS